MYDFMAIKIEAMNCRIDSGKLYDSTVNEARLLTKTSTSNCKIGPLPVAIRKFAPEIRALIFRYLMSVDNPNNYFWGTDKVISAFMGDAELYQEALEVQSKYFVIPIWAMGSPGDRRYTMPDVAWK